MTLAQAEPRNTKNVTAKPLKELAFGVSYKSVAPALCDIHWLWLVL